MIALGAPEATRHEPELRWHWADTVDASVEADDLEERIRRILDGQVNPAIAAHRGHVTLAEVVNGRVSLRLAGGCQGCSLANVTVRQGIERLLRARCPEVVAVVDVTDHAAGTEPFYVPDNR